MVQFTLIGVPTSAGTHGVGLEKAPLQLRRAGLVDRLLAAGVDVEDEGDLPAAVYRPGSADRRRQNLDQVVAVVRRVAERVGRIAADGRAPLVLGGDCTITLGVVAGLLGHNPELGVLYFDGDVDLETPETTRTGIFDGMVVSHLLGSGAPELARVGPRFPLLAPERLALFGFDMLEASEVEQLRARSLHAWPAREIGGRPTEAAAEALATLREHADPLLLHFDVDAIDSSDLPLANYPHFNFGQPFDSAMACLRAFCASPRLAGVVVTEVNPDHDPDGSFLARLVDGLAGALGT